MDNRINEYTNVRVIHICKIHICKRLNFNRLRGGWLWINNRCGIWNCEIFFVTLGSGGRGTSTA